MKKPSQNVAYLSRNSVVSEFFSIFAQQPRWQKMWCIEKLYIEQGCWILLTYMGIKCNTQKSGINFSHNLRQINFQFQSFIPFFLLILSCINIVQNEINKQFYEAISGLKSKEIESQQFGPIFKLKFL